MRAAFVFCFQLILCCYIVCTTVVAINVLDLQNDLISLLRDSQNADLDGALQKIENIPKNTYDFDFTINEIPYMHHVFNIYMFSKGKDKAKAMDLIYNSIDKIGIGIFNPVWFQEPDLIFKSVFIRNLTLALSVSKQQTLLSNSITIPNSDLLKLIYQIPCEPIPLAKLLLHSANIVKSSVYNQMKIESILNHSKTNFVNTKGANSKLNSSVATLTDTELVNRLKLLIAGASLDSSKYTFSGIEYLQYSASYNSTLEELVSSSGIMEKISESLMQYSNRPTNVDADTADTLTSSATHAMLHEHFNQLNDIPLSSLKSILEDMSLQLHRELFHASLTRGNEFNQIQYREMETMFTSVNNKGRNILHMLAISNSHRILEDLFVQLYAVSFQPNMESDVELESNAAAIDSFRTAVLNALVTRDIRNHSPFSLAMSRYGKNSIVYKTLINMLYLVTSTNQALLQLRFLEIECLSRIVCIEPCLEPVSENYDMLFEILEFITYLSSPLQPKQALHDHSNANSGSDVTILKDKFLSHVNDSGGWWTDELTLGVDFDCDHAHCSNSDSDGHREVLTEYVDAYPAHMSVESAVEGDVPENRAAKVELGDENIGDDLNEGSHVDYDMACDVEEVFMSEFPSNEDFFYNYVNRGKPVIFRGLALDTHIRNLFHKDTFLSKYGQDTVPISTIPYANSFGQSSANSNSNAIPITFNEFATNRSWGSVYSPDSNSNEHYYAFTTAPPEWNQKMSRDVGVPPFVEYSALDKGGNLIRNTNIELQFYLGPAGSGAPMHIHGHAVNTMAYGKKQWYLFPPGDAYYSTQPAFEFVKHDARSEKAMHCVQYGGDVMYVPALWGHATFNRKQSIGVAHEFSVESFCME